MHVSSSEQVDTPFGHVGHEQKRELPRSRSLDARPLGPSPVVQHQPRLSLEETRRVEPPRPISLSSFPPTLPRRTAERIPLYALQQPVAGPFHFDMLSKIGLTATLRIYLEQSVIFLHPPLPRHARDGTGFEEPPTTQDPVLRGHVVLDLPRSRDIKSIKVKLEGKHVIGFPGRPWEEGKTIEKTLEIKLEGEDQHLCKGKHTFEFAFIIPSTSAPYERSRFGRVYHRLYATAHSASAFVPNLEEWCPFEMIVNPLRIGRDGGEDQGPLGLDVDAHGFEEEIGTWSLQLSSPHLTPSGLLSFRFNLHEPPNPGLTVHSISAYIQQQFTLKSLKNPSIVSHPPVQKNRLFRLDGESRKNIPGDPDYDERLDFSGMGEDGGPSSPASLESDRTSPSSPISRQFSSFSIGSETSEPSSSSSSCAASTSSSSAPSSWRSSQSSTGTRTRRSPSTTPNDIWSSPPGPSGREASQSPSRSSKPSSGSFGSLRVGPPSQRQPYLKRLEPLTPFTVAHLARLPDDDTLRPSTQPTTETGVRVSHEIVVEVIYSKNSDVGGSEKKRVLRIAKAIEMTSCCCMLESLLLPSYTSTSSTPLPFQASPSSLRQLHAAQPPGPDSAPGLVQQACLVTCICGMSFETMKDKYSKLMSDRGLGHGGASGGGGGGGVRGVEEGVRWRKPERVEEDGSDGSDGSDIGGQGPESEEVGPGRPSEGRGGGGTMSPDPPAYRA